MEMEGLSVLNQHSYHRVLWERRIMFTATLLCVFCVLLFVIAVASTSWAIFEMYDPSKVAGTTAAAQNTTVCIQVGIWGEWIIERDAVTNQIRQSTWIRHFPQPPKTNDRISGLGLLHYYRTQAVFGVVGLVLMLLGNAFALYSFNHHRYMYKRLTAGLLAFVAMCVLVVVEVLIHSVQEWRSSAGGDRSPPQAVAPTGRRYPANNSPPIIHHEKGENDNQMSYGYSTYLSWIVFAVYLGSAFVFLVGGRKQKGNRAATAEFEEEDRPVNLA